jgi:pre-mRNA-splicing factor CDC5/CEF1
MVHAAVWQPQSLPCVDHSFQRFKALAPLAAPQVSDAELEALARAGEHGGGMDVDGLGEGGSAATRALLGDYPTPAATPARTPVARTPAGGGNRVLQEAQNLRALQAGQTPLLGGDNPELHPSDFSGITPRATPAATPNPLAAAAAAAGATPSLGGPAATPSLPGATPGRGGRAVAGISATPSLLGGTPGRGAAAGPGATPTPLRDALGLNDPESLAAASKREERARLALQRNDLRAGLAQLPAPKNEYQVVVPELPGGWGGAGLTTCWGAAASCLRSHSAP